MASTSITTFTPRGKDGLPLKVSLNNNPIIFDLDGIEYTHSDDYRHVMVPSVLILTFPMETLREFIMKNDYERVQYVMSLMPSRQEKDDMEKGILRFHIYMDQLEPKSLEAVKEVFYRHTSREAMRNLNKLAPCMKFVLETVTTKVLQYQKEWGIGYIDTTKPCDTIFGYMLNAEMNCMTECVIKGVRVKEGELEVIAAPYGDNTALTEEEFCMDENWHPLDSDMFDWVPTLLHICEFLPEYIKD